jgi:hemerythrin-like domain-containing protein
MLRDKNLIPLSHQHQRALALCVRIDRAHPISEGDLEAWQRELDLLFQEEIERHFLAEEDVIFTAAGSFSELLPLVEELRLDHSRLRETFSLARSRRLSADNLGAFAQRLSTHIRKEERELFEHMQRLLSSEQLASLGGRLEAALGNAVKACSLPDAATKLRPKRKSGDLA